MSRIVWSNFTSGSEPSDDVTLTENQIGWSLGIGTAIAFSLFVWKVCKYFAGRVRDFIGGQ
jgi:hypothetical protein